MILLAECLVGPLSHAESPAEEIKTEAPPLRTFSKKSQGKIQEVNFEEMGLKGTLRNPEGSYLVQKRGLKFMPLIEVQKTLMVKFVKPQTMSKDLYEHSDDSTPQKQRS